MHDIVMKFEVPLITRKADWDGRELVEGWDSARAHRYMEALKREVAANAGEFGDCRVTAIRWGGGIASMANAQDIAEVMRLVRSGFAVADEAPVSLEAAIANISGASMPFLKRAGVTRFDFEMMSLFPKGYSLVNTRENLGDLPVICDYFLHAASRDNLGIVLLYGYEGTDGENFRRSVVEFLRTPAVHLRLVRAAGPKAADDGIAEAQLARARAILAEGGFVEYAPGTFAKPGFEDPVLVAEWDRAPQIGFGLGALTRCEGAESLTTRDFETYVAHSGDFARITEAVSALPAVA
ncbi:coproporphyrinogen III oxidase [uncultured Adlercreutzia sp.]|uniref:coproporphyrinogen III oxidase n=1 Tax=uncultured Adlercreutzia sp. TaxID=875803 RepID=UPI0025DC888B|nr:coproporphyrinogen III oxidase [uncultured Adlercreutzia sp.]